MSTQKGRWDGADDIDTGADDVNVIDDEDEYVDGEGNDDLYHNGDT